LAARTGLAIATSTSRGLYILLLCPNEFYEGVEIGVRPPCQEVEAIVPTLANIVDSVQALDGAGILAPQTNVVARGHSRTSPLSWPPPYIIQVEVL